MKIGKIKIGKKIIVLAVAVGVVAVAAAIFAPKIVNAMGPKLPEVSATRLSKTYIANTVSVTGTVKSMDATNVYSTLSAQVKHVNVEVGDVVKAGDVLCELDSSDLGAKLEQDSASLAQNQAKAQHNLAVAQNDLATEKFNQENNYDEKLASAESGVEKAKQGLKAAEQDLEAAELSLQSAIASLTNSRKDLRGYRDDTGYDLATYDSVGIAKENSVRQGELSVEKAENGVVEAKSGLAYAKQTLKEAEANLRTVQMLKQETIISGRNQVTSAQLSTDFTAQQLQLEELKKDLDETVVTAPVSGTVTAVIAAEGSSGQGLLFVIENTENLKIDTKIKEYDIASVKAGQRVKVKSDGTGDEEYEGVVSKIAPTAVKDTKGETVETTDVQFETEIGVTGSTNLKIGMNARVDIVTDEKQDVFAISYDALVENEAGGQAVYVARPKDGQVPVATPAEPAGEAGEAESAKITYIVAIIPVTTGLETDVYIEVSSDELKEGDLIISDPTELTEGQEINLAGDFGGMAGGAGRGPGGGGPRVRVGG